MFSKVINMSNCLLLSVVFCAMVVGTHGIQPYTAAEVEELIRSCKKFARANVTLPNSYNEPVTYHPLPVCDGKLFCDILGTTDVVGIPGRLFLQEGWLALSDTVLKEPVVETSPGVYEWIIGFNDTVRMDYAYEAYVDPGSVPVNKGRGYGDIYNLIVYIKVKVVNGKFVLASVDGFKKDKVFVCFYDSKLSKFVDYILNAISATFERLFIELIQKRYARIISEYVVECINTAVTAKAAIGR